MSTTSHPQIEIAPKQGQVSEAVSQGVPPWTRLVLVLGLFIGYLPLLSIHFYQLLERPHYQFALLVPVAIWLLALSQDDSHRENVEDWKKPFPMLLLLAGSVVGLFVAYRYWSPWLAAVSAVIGAIPAMWLLIGWNGMRSNLAPWTLAWMMIPLPFGLDNELIVELRQVTTRLTSQLLDLYGILHLQYGNVIEVPGKQLFIADACSGIHSLYVLIAAALFIGLWQQRSFIHIGLLLCGSFLLVIVENVARLFLIAALLEYRIDLSEGLKHTFLGGGLFALSLLFLVSLDQLIQFFLANESGSTLYQRLFVNRRRRYSAKPRPLSWVVTAVFTGAVGISLVMAAVNYRQAMARMPSFAELSIEEIDLELIGKQSLEDVFHGFTFDEYKVIDRVPGDPFGQASQQWTYRYGEMTVRISIDYPYDGIHDLCVCYDQIGWSIIEPEVLSSEQLEADSISTEFPVATTNLYRQLHGHAFLTFSLFDTQGNTTAVIKQLIDRDLKTTAQNRWGAEQDVTRDELRRQQLSPPYLQVQMLVTLPEQVSAEQKKMLLERYVRARDVLRETSLNMLSESR